MVCLHCLISAASQQGKPDVILRELAQRFKVSFDVLKSAFILDPRSVPVSYWRVDDGTGRKDMLALYAMYGRRGTVVFGLIPQDLRFVELGLTSNTNNCHWQYRKGKENLEAWGFHSNATLDDWVEKQKQGPVYRQRMRAICERIHRERLEAGYEVHYIPRRQGQDEDE